MPRKKKVVEAEAVETTKTEAVESAPEVKTETKSVKVKPAKVEETPLEKDGTFLVTVNGEDTYWTRYQIHIAQTRGMSVVIPKGSPFVQYAKSKNCENCG